MSESLRVVVLGATGNAGTTVVDALAAELRVGSIVGVARRRPRVGAAKVEWRTANIVNADLVSLELEQIPVSSVEPAAISTAIWEKAQEKITELRGRTGAERYDERLDAFGERLESADESGGDPGDVAATIEKALTEKSPGARYPVGASAKLVGALKPLIPDPLLDKLTGRIAK